MTILLDYYSLSFFQVAVFLTFVALRILLFKAHLPKACGLSRHWAFWEDLNVNVFKWIKWMILNLVVIQIDNVKNKFCKCFRKLKSLLLKVRVDIRKWKDTLETERNLCKIQIR